MEKGDQMANTRRKKILELLDMNGSVSLTELNKLFSNVSSMTLRRDLIQLENDGYVIRVLGGAVKSNQAVTHPGEESAYAIRASEQQEAKNKIAKKALSFLETGRSIYLDAGSTIMYLAKLIPDEHFSLITSSINIAQLLLSKKYPSVVVLGGFANRNTLSMSGPLTAPLLDSINIDTAFISASGFSKDNHFTVSNIYEAELKTKVISKAKKVVILMDASKIGKSLSYTFAKLSDIHVFLTEDTLSEDIKSYIEEQGVSLE